MTRSHPSAPSVNAVSGQADAARSLGLVTHLSNKASIGRTQVRPCWINATQTPGRGSPIGLPWSAQEAAVIDAHFNLRASMAAGILAAAESLCAKYWAGSRCSGGRCSPPLLSAMTNTRLRSRPLVRAV